MIFDCLYIWYKGNHLPFDINRRFGFFNIFWGDIFPQHFQGTRICVTRRVPISPIYKIGRRMCYSLVRVWPLNLGCCITISWNLMFLNQSYIMEVSIVDWWHLDVNILYFLHLHQQVQLVKSTICVSLSWNYYNIDCIHLSMHFREFLFQRLTIVNYTYD